MKKLLVLASVVMLVVVAWSQLATYTPYGTTVVASAKWTGQTGAIGTSTLYTPAIAGNYRVSIYMETSNFVNNASQIACGFVGWMDDYNTYAWPSGYGTCIYPNAFDTYSVVIHSAAGRAITFDGVLGDFGTPGSPPVAAYNVFVVVEKL